MSASPTAYLGRLSANIEPANGTQYTPAAVCVPLPVFLPIGPLSPVETSSHIVVLSGPSGSGKSTIVQRLLVESPVPLQMAVSATTRPSRPGEIHGTHYYFLDRPQFEAKLQAGEFLEWAEVHRSGYLYGTLKSELRRIWGEGKWPLLEVDVEGAQSIMRLYPEALSIFLTASSMQEFENRLRSRGTETEEVIRRRLQTAERELRLADSYRYRVVNDDLNRAVREICDLLAVRAAT
jgi:guanylate kinase